MCEVNSQTYRALALNLSK